MENKNKWEKKEKWGKIKIIKKRKKNVGKIKKKNWKNNLKQKSKSRGKWGKHGKMGNKSGKSKKKGKSIKKLPSVITSFVSFSLLRYPIKTLRPHPAISPISGLKPPSSIGVLVTSSFLLLKILVLTPGTDLPVVSNLMYLKEKKIEQKSKIIKEFAEKSLKSGEKTRIQIMVKITKRRKIRKLFRKKGKN